MVDPTQQYCRGNPAKNEACAMQCGITRAELEFFKTAEDGRRYCTECGHSLGVHPVGATVQSPDNLNNSSDSAERKSRRSGSSEDPAVVARDTIIEKQKNGEYFAPVFSPPVLEFRDRGKSERIAGDYIADVLTKAPPDNKFSVLGTFGVKGIGKTQMLRRIGTKVAQDVARTLSKRIHPAYVTFNGGGTYKNLFLASLRKHQEYARAFGHVLLGLCGVPQNTAGALDFDTCLALFRNQLGVKDDDVLLICVDELGDLEKAEGEATLGGLMSAMDRYGGKLIFVFAHIMECFLTSGATGSGREVICLPLPPLAINVWSENEELKQAAENDAAFHQLLLSCSGHPRSVYDGIKAAREDNPTLLTRPTEDALSAARQRIIRKCKFNDLSTGQITTAVHGWFSGGLSDEQQDALVYSGILQTIVSNAGDKVDFLYPLLVQEWARQQCEKKPIAFHLHQLYAADAMVGEDTEKKMEPIMYHYESVLRIALAGHVTTLQAFYETKHVGPEFGELRVVAPVVERHDQVQFLKDFSDIDEVLRYLRMGLIVVSKAHSETGVEYLSPFRDAETKELIVAAVQCKFVKKKAVWSEIAKKMDDATKGLREKNVNYFPVVYTTADQKGMQKDTFANAVYFLEEDIFRFTNKLGVLRLHTQKLGTVLKRTYPMLEARKRARNKNG